MPADGCAPYCDSSRLPLRIKALLAVLFLFVVLATHGGSRHGPFVFDDEGAIIGNDSIHSLSFESLETVLWGGKFTTVVGRPLLNFSLAMNYAWGGLRPKGYHLVNYAIHAAAAFFLFCFMRRVLCQFADTHVAAIPLALTVSVLWCIHPLTINGVSYLCQRAESLASVFYLIVLWGFVKGVQTSEKRWFLCSVLAAWLGGLTKEIIATVPLTAIAQDVLVITRDWRQALCRHWGAYLGLLSSWLPLGYCVWASKSRDGTVGFEIGVSLQDHAQTQIWALARYLQLSVWPFPLIFDYGDRFVVSEPGQLWMAMSVVVCLGFLMVWMLVRRWPLAFPAVALCLLLAPTSIIPIATQTVAEHRMYLGSACVTAAFVLALYLILARCSQYSVASRSVAFAVVLVPVAAVLTMSTILHTRVFASSESLWADTVSKHPTNQRAIYNLAIAKFNRKSSADDDEAMRLCVQAIELPGDFRAAAYELRGLIFSRKGDGPQAVDDLTRAISLRPFVEYYQSRAKVLRDLGRFDDALLDLDQARSIDPTNKSNDLIRGSIHVARGEFAQALESYDRLLAQDPGHVTARHRRVVVYARLSRWQDASQEIQRLQREGRVIDEKLVREVEQNLAKR